MLNIDLTDIARGRRLTAITAAELAVLPRQSKRPARRRITLRLMARVLRRLLH